MSKLPPSTQDKEKNLRRAEVVSLENHLNKLIEQGKADCGLHQTSLKHYFIPPDPHFGCGTYTRELSVPKGMTFTGKIHRHSHMVFVLKGEFLVVSESGREHIKAPATWVSPAGTKRAFYALEDSIISTVHLTKHSEEQDLEAIEEETIAPSFSAMGIEEPQQEIIANIGVSKK